MSGDAARQRVRAAQAMALLSPGEALCGDAILGIEHGPHLWASDVLCVECPGWPLPADHDGFRAAADA